MSDGVTFAGIDWASMLHVACVVGGDGQVVDRFEFTHDAEAITDMIRRMKRVKASGVAIERGDGPVVEALMDSGLAVYVVPPRQVKALRERYGSAGNKDDVSTRISSPTHCEATDTAGDHFARTAIKPRRCEHCAGPERTSSRSASGLPTSYAPTWSSLSPANWPNHDARQPDHAQLLASLSHRREGALPVARANGRLAAIGWLQRRHRHRGAPWPLVAAAQLDRDRGESLRTDHPRPGGHHRDPQRADHCCREPSGSAHLRHSATLSIRRKTTHQPPGTRASPPALCDPRPDRCAYHHTVDVPREAAPITRSVACQRSPERGARYAASAIQA